MYAFIAKVSAIQYKMMHNNGSRAPDTSRGGEVGGPDGKAASREAETSAWEKGSGDGKSRLLQRRNVSRWLKARSARHDVKSAAGSEQPGGADGNKIFHYCGENI